MLPGITWAVRGGSSLPGSNWVLKSQPAPEACRLPPQSWLLPGLLPPPLRTGKTQCWGLFLLSKARNFTCRYFPHVYFPGLGDLQRSLGCRRVTSSPSLRNGEMPETSFPWNPVLHCTSPSVSEGTFLKVQLYFYIIQTHPEMELYLWGGPDTTVYRKDSRDSSLGNCWRLSPMTTGLYTWKQ